MDDHFHRGRSYIPLPTTLFNSFVPGYDHIHRSLTYILGFDATVLVSVGAALWLLARICRSAWAAISTLLSYCAAEVTVSNTEEIYEHLISFLAHQNKVNSRRVMANMPLKSTWGLAQEQIETPEWTAAAAGNTKWLNFSNQEARSQPRFTPAIGSHWFWHKGKYFNLRRREVAMFDEFSSGGTTFKDKELLTLSCFGRTTDPIRELIQCARVHYYHGHSAKTVIKCPASKELRRFPTRCWAKIAERPCRPMQTVVLNEERRLEVLVDINEYLSPTTATWYANRGIPYRRGYLFYGPPGTGKTSLTFAIAGIFGLDIHVVSLLEPTLTEEDLGTLFTNLPPRCIVLLEDIDTAGLLRDPNSVKETLHDAANNNHLTLTNLAKALGKEEKKQGISLSSLLNVIDGVASHEGRVLVMTTNYPEKLDKALIRPGRIDHQVAFSNATENQVKELFERMYTNDLLSGGEQKFRNTDLGPEELSATALEFTKQVPAGKFSPAEIQGFLLTRKNDPKKAVDGVGIWVKEMSERKSNSG